MKKEVTVPVVLIIVLIIGAVGYFIYKNPLDLQDVCVENKACFKAYIADSDNERVKGLSGRGSLGEDKGMLFIFQEQSTSGFWMNDMKFPLDIIWINSDFEIVGIDKNLQPCENSNNCPIYYPDSRIMYVLEINAGLSDLYGFEEGDSVSF